MCAEACRRFVLSFCVCTPLYQFRSIRIAHSVYVSLKRSPGRPKCLCPFLDLFRCPGLCITTANPHPSLSDGPFNYFLPFSSNIYLFLDNLFYRPRGRFLSLLVNWSFPSLAKTMTLGSMHFDAVTNHSLLGYIFLCRTTQKGNM